MRKTPSYLRGLAETRARADAEAIRIRNLIAELEERLRTVEAERASCDMLIRKLDERLDPTQIVPIQAWQGRYGRRGFLKEAVSEYLAKAYPQEASTIELAVAIEAKFGLDFATGEDRRKWRHNSLASCLKALTEDGVVERLHDPEGTPPGGVGWWRLAVGGSGHALSQLPRSDAEA